MATIPEISDIEQRAAGADIKMSEVLRLAGVAQTTWWRWGEGHFEPRIKTLRRVRTALDDLIVERSKAA